MRLFCVIFLICCVYIEGLWSIRAKLRAIPPTVARGGNAILECTYELQGASLYTVKWYRGQHEFYKFTPKETPQKKTFSVLGLNVDELLSNDTQVMLTNMELSLSGNFSCEVSAESPFTTAVVYTYVEIVSLPESGPVIRAERLRYNSGDILRANCSTPPSKPAANLTFLINNEEMSLAAKHIHKSENGLEWSEVTMTEPLKNFHFKGGNMVLKCMARVQPIYLKTTMNTYAALSDPKPERIIMEIQVNVKPIIYNLVTSANAGAATITVQLVLIAMLLCVSFVVSSDYEDYFYDVQDSESPEISEHVKTSLLGF